MCVNFPIQNLLIVRRGLCQAVGRIYIGLTMMMIIIEILCFCDCYTLDITNFIQP